MAISNSPIPEELKGDPEEIIARWNQSMLFKEFTFSKTDDYRDPLKPHEFGDNLIWLEDNMILFQSKGREKLETDFESDEKEKKWFDRVVVGEAVTQISENLQHLKEKGTVSLTNERGHEKILTDGEVKNWQKIALFRPHRHYGAFNPYHRRFYRSSRAGFVHLLSLYEYLEMLIVLRTPMEIILYLQHREILLTQFEKECSKLPERALLGHYIVSDLNENIGLRIVPNVNLQNVIPSLKIGNLPNSNLYAVLDRLGEGTLLPNLAPFEAENFHKLLLQFAVQKRVIFEKLDSLLSECLQTCSSAQFNEAGNLGFRIRGPMIVPATQTGFTFLVVNQHDILGFKKIMVSGTRATMIKHIRENPPTMNLKYHVGIAMIYSAPQNLDSF